MKKGIKNKFTTRDIAFYGLFIALVYVATRFINIPGPNSGGLFHLGNVMAFSIAIVFGKKAGAVSAALGMALFDLTSPYAIYAPFTFVIRFAMGYVIGYMANMAGDKKIETVIFSFGGIAIASVIMIVGYYCADILILGTPYAAYESVGPNFMQCVVGTVIGLPVAVSLKLGFKARKISLDL
jgi:uncharacterized membrane protein